MISSEGYYVPPQTGIHSECASVAGFSTVSVRSKFSLATLSGRTIPSIRHILENSLQLPSLCDSKYRPRPPTAQQYSAYYLQS
jgi:hypothetical protein